MKLDVKAFALACGLMWGVGVLALTWWLIGFEGATGEPTLVGRVYRHHLQLEVVAKHAHHVLRLAQPQQPVVDEDTG